MPKENEQLKMPERTPGQLKQDVTDVAIMVYTKNALKSQLNKTFNINDPENEKHWSDVAKSESYWGALFNGWSAAELYAVYNYIIQNEDGFISCLNEKKNIPIDGNLLLASTEDIEKAIPKLGDLTIQEKITAIDNAIKAQKNKINNSDLVEEDEKIKNINEVPDNNADNNKDNVENINIIDEKNEKNDLNDQHDNKYDDNNKDNVENINYIDNNKDIFEDIKIEKDNKSEKDDEDKKDRDLDALKKEPINADNNKVIVEDINLIDKKNEKIVPNNQPGPLNIDNNKDIAEDIIIKKDNKSEKKAKLNRKNHIINTNSKQNINGNKNRTLEELKKDVAEFADTMLLYTNSSYKSKEMKHRILGINSKSALYDLYNQLLTTKFRMVYDTVMNFNEKKTKKTDDDTIEKEIPRLQNVSVDVKIWVVHDCRQKYVKKKKETGKQKIDYDILEETIHCQEKYIRDHPLTAFIKNKKVIKREKYEIEYDDSNNGNSDNGDSDESIDPEMSIEAKQSFLADGDNCHHVEFSPLKGLAPGKVALINEYRYVTPFRGGDDYRCVRACTDGFEKDIEDYTTALKQYNDSTDVNKESELYSNFLYAADKCLEHAVKMYCSCKVYISRKLGELKSKGKTEKDLTGYAKSRYDAIHEMAQFSKRVMDEITDNKTSIKLNSLEKYKPNYNRRKFKAFVKATKAKTELMQAQEQLNADNKPKWSFMRRKFNDAELETIRKNLATIIVYGNYEKYKKKMEHSNDFDTDIAAMVNNKEFVTAVNNAYRNKKSVTMPALLLNSDKDPIAIAARKCLNIFDIGDENKKAYKDLLDIYAGLLNNDGSKPLFQRRLATIIAASKVKNDPNEYGPEKNINKDQFEKIVNELFTSRSFNDMCQHLDATQLMELANADRTGKNLRKCYDDYCKQELRNAPKKSDKKIRKKNTVTSNVALKDRQGSMLFAYGDDSDAAAVISKYEIMKNTLTNEQLNSLEVNRDNEMFDIIHGNDTDVSLPKKISEHRSALNNTINMTQEDKKNHLAAIIAGNMIRLENRRQLKNNVNTADEKELEALTNAVKDSIAFKIMTGKESINTALSFADDINDSGCSKLFKAYHRCYQDNKLSKNSTINKDFISRNSFTSNSNYDFNYSGSRFGSF